VKLRRLHVAGVLIIGAWLASLGWLARREYFGEAPGQLAASARVTPGAVFFGVYVDGRQVGVAASTVDTLPDGIRIAERFDVELPDPGPNGAGDGSRTRRIRGTSETRLSPDLELVSFDHSVGGDAPAVAVRGRVMPGGILAVELAWPGRQTESHFAAGGALPIEAVPLRALVDGPLEQRRRIEFPIIDPLTGAVRQTAWMVSGPAQFVVPDSAMFDSAAGLWVPAHLDTIMAWALLEENSSLGTRIWIDQQGFTVRAESRYGWTLERTAFEIAQLNLRAGFPRRERTPPLAYGMRKPLLMRPVQPADTAPAPLVPANDPALDSLARRLAPDSASAEARARAIFTHVARRIRPGDPQAPPDPIRALRSGRGSDASRALLFVALARAAGIPAATTTGARFNGTAWEPAIWASVHLGEWIDVDPAGREWPADSLRIGVRIDGAAHPLEFLAPVARLQRTGPGPAVASTP